MCDIDLKDLNISLESIKKTFQKNKNNNTVHLWGILVI